MKLRLGRPTQEHACEQMRCWLGWLNNKHAWEQTRRQLGWSIQGTDGMSAGPPAQKQTGRRQEQPTEGPAGCLAVLCSYCLAAEAWGRWAAESRRDTSSFSMKLTFLGTTPASLTHCPTFHFINSNSWTLNQIFIPY